MLEEKKKLSKTDEFSGRGRRTATESLPSAHNVTRRLALRGITSGSASCTNRAASAYTVDSGTIVPTSDQNQNAIHEAEVFIALRNIPGFTTPSTIATGLTRFATRVPPATVGTGWTAPGGIAEVTSLAASYQPHVGVRAGLKSRRNRGGSSSPSDWQHEPLVGQHLWEMVSILSTPASNTVHFKFQLTRAWEGTNNGTKPRGGEA